MSDMGDYIDELVEASQRADRLIQPKTIAAVDDACKALYIEHSRLVDVAAQIEDRDVRFREMVQANIDFIENSISALALVRPVPELQDGGVNDGTATAG